MGKGWTARRYTPADREQIYALCAAVHGAEKTASCRRNWVWEFESNPYVEGAPHIWVAEDEDRIVGVHPTIAVPLQWGQTRYRALWSADLMTHPDYRGQGIFKVLTERLLEGAREEGIAACLVLPNRNSGPLLRKRGWFDIKTFPVMIKPVRLGPLLRQVSFRSLPKAAAGALAMARRSLSGPGQRPVTHPVADVRIESLTGFDERLDELFSAVAGEYDFSVVRDREYLTWRYSACPGDRHTVLAATTERGLAGFIVIDVEAANADRGHIVEFLVRPGGNRDAVAAALLDASLSRLKARGVASIEMCAQGLPYDDWLACRGFTTVSRETFWGYDLVAYALQEGDFEKALRDSDKKWLLSRGDADSDMATA